MMQLCIDCDVTRICAGLQHSAQSQPQPPRPGQRHRQHGGRGQAQEEDVQVRQPQARPQHAGDLPRQPRRGATPSGHHRPG